MRGAACWLLRRFAPCAQELDAAGEIEARQAEKQAELDRVSREITLSDSRVAALAAEIAGIKKDHASDHGGADPGRQDRAKLGEDIEDITGKLEDLKEQAGGDPRCRWSARRDVLAEVLGALQRMGLNPPPAMLVKPEDALSSVRSAILLGAVVPGTAPADRGAARRPARSCRASPPRSRPSARG